MIKELEKKAIKNNDVQYFEQNNYALNSHLITYAVNNKKKQMVDYFLSKGLKFESPFSVIHYDDVKYLQWIESREINISYGGELYLCPGKKFINIFKYLLGKHEDKKDFYDRLFSQVFVNFKFNYAQSKKNKITTKEFAKNEKIFIEMLSLVYPKINKNVFDSYLLEIEDVEYRNKVLSEVLISNIIKIDNKQKKIKI